VWKCRAFQKLMQGFPLERVAEGLGSGAEEKSGLKCLEHGQQVSAQNVVTHWI
jgi:hypothetical protein